MSEEFEPLVDQLRLYLLAAYEVQLRPHIGESLNNGIDIIKIYLDKYMPAE